MKGRSRNFILGLCGGTILVSIFTSWNMVYGALAMGVIFGIMNYELQRLDSLNTRETESD